MLRQAVMRGLTWASGVALLAAASCHSGEGSPTGLSSEECADACAKIAAADCGDVGSGCVNSCARGPAALPSSGDCGDEESAYFNCFWSAASYLCDEAIGTLPLGCDAERSRIKSCQSGVGGATGDGGEDGAVQDGGTAGAGGAG